MLRRPVIFESYVDSKDWGTTVFDIFDARFTHRRYWIPLVSQMRTELWIRQIATLSNALPETIRLVSLYLVLSSLKLHKNLTHIFILFCSFTATTFSNSS
jgi:hypothetical protein